MPLETYRRKRDFTRTSEPAGGKTVRKGGGASFVVQKHAATRLHYDFRLEMTGVLVSWAVTRGPSLVPGEKRLAVHVEDHPLEYGDFEGTIPKGEYGGGAVIVWDRGTWKPIGNAEQGLAKGHLDFELDGSKLKGRWHLVRMARRPREKRDNWLLIKGDDEFARNADQPDILEELPNSAKTGRPIEEVAGEEPGWSSKTGRIDRKPAPSGRQRKPKASDTANASFPGFIEPALATLRPSAPEGDRWVHEIKFDGYRLQAHIRNGKASLVTRTGLDWTGKFGDAVTDALAKLPVKQAILDGELVVEGAGGASDFSALQADLSAGRTDRFVFYLFDALHVDGRDLRPLPLLQRKEELVRLLKGADATLRYSEHFEDDGDMVLRHACRLSLEGVVSKLRDSPYPTGRSRDWIKSKCSDRQEFVIGGYVPSTVSNKAVGSLVLGYFEEGRLIHAGRVGTGFSNAVAEDLFRRLEAIRRPGSPFAEKLPADAARHVRYVEPSLVAEVEFQNWTSDGLLRHSSFRGLREDKPAGEVVREGKPGKAASRPRAAVRLTHPDRVYWPDSGVTKEGLADYYTQVWPLMAPFVVSRPIALLRCPSGTSGQCFFQKHEWKGQSREILTFDDPLDRSSEKLVAIDSLDGLIGLVQGATLEIHPWQSTLQDLEHPDQIIMDLDPGEGVPWEAVIEAAGEVRQRLEAVGLNAFVKTSGGKGLHVVTPLRPRAGWDEVKGFAKAIADAMASDSPDRYVATISKAKRTRKILVDYLRNGRGATAVAPYSTRARPGAPVAMPLDWDEVGPAIGPGYFTVESATVRVRKLKSDPWADFRKAEKPLPVALTGSRKGRRAA